MLIDDGIYFFFIKIPNCANIYNSVHDRNFQAIFEPVSEPRPYTNSPCQCIRPLTSALASASVQSLPTALSTPNTSLKQQIYV